MSNRNLDEKRIIEIAQSLIGKPIRGLEDVESNKGGFGMLIEEEGFGIMNNSDSGADFIKENIELKTTPYKKNKDKTYSAKERLVLNIINYMNEYDKTFETSSFWIKNKKLLILFYLYEKEVPKNEFVIDRYLLHEFDNKDLLIIRNDWKFIIDKIRQGKAHEISEADTMYLSACTKGKNRDSVREQPFSSIPAKQRAFSLKTTYMTQLIRKKFFQSQEASIFNAKELEKETFEELIRRRILEYRNSSVDELKQLFNIKGNPKNLNRMIIGRILKINGDITKTDEFLKSNIVLKTIRVQKNKAIKESLSLPVFSYKNLATEEWDTSEIKEYFETTKFLFVIFRENSDGKYLLDDVIFWNMPLSIIEKEVFVVWKKTQETILSGNIVKEIKKQKNRILYKTNFPGLKFNKYCHVRPHAANFKDAIELPKKDNITGLEKYMKHCFWINSNYLKWIIEKRN